MDEKLTRVECSMDDCLYYVEKEEAGMTLTYCKHPDRNISKDNYGCPLYRMDWAKRVKKK